MSRNLSECLGEVLTEVRRLRTRFAHTAPRKWEPVTAAAELAVQVGHLALCVLRRNGSDISSLEDPDRPLTDIGDELADVALAALSIAVLAQAEHISSVPRPASTANGTEAFHRLLVAAGVLSEVAMVEACYRHQPAGRPVPLPEAATAVIAACEELAEHLGLDLLAEFRSMTADADRFLNQWVMRDEAPR